MHSITIAFICIAVTIGYTKAGLTVEDIRESIRTMRAVCQPQHSVSDVQIKNFLQPENQDTNLKCYLHCMLDMARAMKKGKIWYDNILKQIDLFLPNELKPDYKKALAACQNVGSGITDPCEIAFRLTLCFVENNPNIILE